MRITASGAHSWPREQHACMPGNAAGRAPRAVHPHLDVVCLSWHMVVVRKCIPAAHLLWHAMPKGRLHHLRSTPEGTNVM